MKCTCDHARREAQAEAFREAAEIARGFTWWESGDHTCTVHKSIAEEIERRAAQVAHTAPGAPAGAAIPVPPVSGNPETASPLSGPLSAAMDLPEDESLSAAIAKLIEDDGFITEWPDSYPFRDLDPWPDNPAEACK